MGVRIDMENKIDVLDRRLKLAEGALEEIIRKVDELLKNNTRVQHVDIHKEVKEIPEEKTEEIVETNVSEKKKDKEEKVSA